MTSLPDPIIFDSSKHSPLLPLIASLHASCITIDGTIATFLPPLNHDRMLDWWTGHTKDAARTIILQLVPLPTSSSFMDLDSDAVTPNNVDVAGVVMLVKQDHNEGGRFRASVEKLLVSPRYRERGIARRLMEKLEVVARGKRLTLLLLDTVTESPANEVYPRLGWVKIGTIPEFEMSPVDGKLKDNTFYYKNLLKG